ncbi:MAG: ABC transporter substrate-binding protein [bacterium]|nr:ABC transporter substrate-binding protein [bacterium]
MDRVTLALLRGVCQLPAYVAADLGLFRAHGLEVALDYAPTAWAVPERMLRGQVDFAVIPWTRVAAAGARGEPLVLICGSGCEEAALVVRRGCAPTDVARVALPQEGGMKDLTAVGLVQSLGWGEAETLRLPSGDAAILAFVGGGVDAASMVEPWATMLHHLGLGDVVRRTRDVWPGVPGCSLTTSAALIAERPDVVERMVRAFVAGARVVGDDPERAAAIGARHIGVEARHVSGALAHNAPDVHALGRSAAMDAVLDVMLARGYLARRPDAGFKDLTFLERARRGAAAA